MKQKLAAVSVVAAGILWGMIALFIRGLNTDGFESLEIVLLRSSGALILMFAFLFIYDRSLLRIRLKDLWCFIGTGILSLTFFNWCYFRTIVLTSLSVASILLYTAPVMVVLFSAALFHERLTVRKLLCMFAAFLGCALVTGIFSGNGAAMNTKGLLIGLGAGLGYALYSIFGRYAIERGYSSYTISFYTFLFATVGTLPLVKTTPIIQKMTGENGMKNLLLIAGLALFSTVLPYLLYTLGLTCVENGRASIMASIEPVVATILGVLVYGEHMSVQGVIGMLLVMGAIIFLSPFPDSKCVISEPPEEGV